MRRLRFKMLIISLLFAGLEVYGQHPLMIPDTMSGTEFYLELQHGTHSFLPGTSSATMGANGSILGPTLIINKGDSIHLSVKNSIGDTTTIHWHGLHVAPENDGGPHTSIAPGEVWNPRFKVRDEAATYWYHPHLHHRTNYHVTMGLSGLILVRDSVEQSLNLPRAYGVDDFPLVLQTKHLDSLHQIDPNSNQDWLPMVNATVDPVLEVPAQWVRFRVLNGSSQRSFNLGLSNQSLFYQIASDAGLLEEPYPTNRLLLSPGERAELMINFATMQDSILSLMSYASEIPSGIFGAQNPGMNPNMALDNYHPNPLNGANFQMLQFQVVESNNQANTELPAFLTEVEPHNPNQRDLKRVLEFSPMMMGMNQLNSHFLINNQSFSMDVINYEIPLNNMETWTLRNNSAMAHPFHVHDVPFYILSRNGAAPPINERGRKDVVLVYPMEEVEIILHFITHYNPDIPYMYHCHLLPHEDHGMMGQFIVYKPLSDEHIDAESFSKVFPNPVQDRLHIELSNRVGMVEWKLFDSRMLEIMQGASSGAFDLQVGSLAPGVYALRLEGEGAVQTHLVMVQ